MARKGKSTGLPSGTWVERDLFTGRAFLSLRGVAPQLLINILGKRDRQKVIDRKGKKDHAWVNLNNLTMTYKELLAMGVSQPRATRGFDELLAKGFLTIIKKGGAYQKDKTVYGLSEKWRFWEPGEVIETRDADVRRGFQGNNRN